MRWEKEKTLKKSERKEDGSEREVFENRETDRQTDRHTNRQTDRHRHSYSQEIDNRKIETDRLKHTD